VRAALSSSAQPDAVRAEALAALLAGEDPQLLEAVETLLADRDGASIDLRRRWLATLARLEMPEVADVALRAYPKFEPELQPQVIVLLASRPAWGQKMLAAVAARELDPSAIGANQIRRLLASGDEDLRGEMTRVWGTLRTDRSPDRERVIAQVRQAVRTTPADPLAGRAIFGRVCGNCHKLYGQGQEVGPDITLNGRGSFEQLLSNVLDPSLVIGAAYQARTIVTDDGRILAGLLVEDSPQRVVLKQQGGKLETIARADIAQIETSKLSLMPEDLDKQLQPQELVDLLTYLALDREPENPQARWLSGFDGPAARETRKP